LTGAFLLTQALLSAMLKNRWDGSSISQAWWPNGTGGQVNYAAAKAGSSDDAALAREVASRGVT